MGLVPLWVALLGCDAPSEADVSSCFALSVWFTCSIMS